jgi:hypothetical protein
MSVFRKISRFFIRLVAVLLLLVLSLWLLIQTDPVQNWLLDKVTPYLSKTLKTKVSVRHINFVPFNEFALQGVLIRDQHADTLLYAGAIKVNCTDWPFFKKDIDLKYINLQDAVINAQRSDSVWNYQFLINLFSSPGPTPKKGGPVLSLKEVQLENVRVAQVDKWTGQDLILGIGSLHLLANEINFNTKKVDIDEVSTGHLHFTLANYPGLRPEPVTSAPAGKITVAPKILPMGKDSLQWNNAGWDITVKTLRLEDCRFQNEGYTPQRPVFTYFDPQHIDWNHINGDIRQVHFFRDTLSAHIVSLATKERSGFEVKHLTARAKFTPRIMEFKSLDILTNHSHVRDYYAMRYDGFNDSFGDFVTKVNLKGEFKDCQVSTDDIAYFAPELKSWKKVVDLNGRAEGPVSALKGYNLSLKAGQTTYIDGDFSMVGLPDIDRTVMNFTLRDLRTTFDDVAVIVPSLRQLTQPNLATLQRIQYKGTFDGKIDDFMINGNMQTNLGTVVTDIHLTFPYQGTSSYKGKITATEFDMGTFLGIKNLGAFSFDGTVDGKGFSFETLDASLKGQIADMTVNNYKYQHLAVEGNFKKKLFDGHLSIDDPNAAFNLDGKIRLDTASPVFNFDADISRLNFKPLGWGNRDLAFQGKLALDFSGRNIDQFIGTAKLYEATLTNEGEPLSFDSLTLSSDTAAGKKLLSLQSLPVNAKVEGQFHILELPKVVQWYLGKYYPSYIKPIPDPDLTEDFTFTIHTDDVEDYLDLLKVPMTGFDNSDISGRISTTQHIFNVDVTVPEFSYKRFEFNDITLKATGNDQKIKLDAALGETILSDSLRLPTTRISIASQNDNSVVAVQTSATQNLNSATLIAKVHNTTDGISAHFDSSSFVLNDKKWLISPEGEIDLKKNWINIQNLNLSSGIEQLSIATKPSSTNPGANDIEANLNRVTIEDLLPLVLKEPHLEGEMSGTISILDPFGKFSIVANTHTDKFKFETDSIGTVTANATYEGGDIHYTVASDNPKYKMNGEGSINLKDSANQAIHTTLNLDHTSIHVLEHYLNIVFTDIDGLATGVLHIDGSLDDPQFTGKVNLQNGVLRVNYTQCKYLFDNEDIDFRPGVIDLEQISLKDTLGNTALLQGTLSESNFFKDMSFNLRLNSNRLLVLNTTARDNKNFYGKAIARVNASLSGPQSNIVLDINRAEAVDSSDIYVPSGAAKAGALPDFIVFKEYGKEMSGDDASRQISTNFTVNMSLQVNNYAKIYVLLDPTNGDLIKAQGNGNLLIKVGTSTPLTINGAYNIESGEYTFVYSNLEFRKPFTLSEGNIRWIGDPYGALININASYLATDVIMPNLTSSTGVQISQTTNIIILCHLTNTLNHPVIDFQFQLPQDNPYKNDPIVNAQLKKYEEDKGEMQKQVTALLIAGTFVSSDDALATNVSSGTLVAGTVGQVVTTQLSATIRVLLKKALKDNTIDPYVTINPSFAFQGNQNLSAVTNASKMGFNKTFLKGMLVFKVGASLDYSTLPQFAQKNSDLIWSPDVAVQWSISQDGHLRLIGYNHTNFDLTYGKYNRTGVSLSYRKDFDRLIDLFASERKKLDARRPSGPTPPPAGTPTGSPASGAGTD